MIVSAAQLKKLRKCSLRELCVRGSQQAAKWGERLRRMVPEERGDAAWLADLRPPSRRSSPEASAAFILERIRAQSGATFLPSLARRSEIQQFMNSRFAAERHRLIARADRVCRARFDLLGLSDLSF